MKKIYITPQTEIIHVLSENLMDFGESKVKKGDDSTESIKNGDPTQSGFHLAKGNNYWDDEFEDAKSDQW